MKRLILAVVILVVSACALTPDYHRVKYCDEHSELKDNVRRAILEGRIIIGMTKSQVLAACGTPLNRKQAKDDSDSSEVWYYKFGEKRIHFADSVVVDISSSTAKNYRYVK